jgi:hypothetical protein
MRARTTAQVSVSAPPLVVVPLNSLAVDAAVGISGEPATVTMIAEQQVKALDGARTQLVELFECSKW